MNMRSRARMAAGGPNLFPANSSSSKEQRHSSPQSKPRPSDPQFLCPEFGLRSKTLVFETPLYLPNQKKKSRIISWKQWHNISSVALLAGSFIGFTLTHHIFSTQDEEQQRFLNVLGVVKLQS